MEKTNYNLVFNRKGKLNKEGKGLIQVEAYLNKKKKYFSTKIYVKPNQWDNQKKCIKNHPQKNTLNQYLTTFVADIEQIEFNAIQNGISFSLDLLKDEKNKDNTSFLSFMDEEIKRSHLKESTKKNHLSTLQQLSSYKKNISFKEMNFNLLCDFEHYLLDNGYHANTIVKHMKHVKRYINLAINKGLFTLQRYPFRQYKIKHIETNKEHLTPEELNAIEQLTLTQPESSFQYVLDMFLFCCYTGLRYSDVVRLTNDNFYQIENKLWLIYTTVKTNVQVRLPLPLLFKGKAVKLYEKYQKRQTETLFDFSKKSNSYINQQLKLISKAANIDKRITFHTARHTNATLLLYKGVNITTVQKLLGHKSVKTTEIYSKIMDITLVRDLENADM
jgi:integrase